MSRLHKLYDRVVHRGDTAQAAVPVPVDDTTTTLRIVRDEDIGVAQDLEGLDVDELAYGDDATPSDTTSDGAQLDDDHAFNSGVNWVESLEMHAIEDGPEPEHEVEIVDDRDVTPSSDTKDRPIADLGSAGARGL